MVMTVAEGGLATCVAGRRAGGAGIPCRAALGSTHSPSLHHYSERWTIIVLRRKYLSQVLYRPMFPTWKAVHRTVVVTGRPQTTLYSIYTALQARLENTCLQAAVC